MIEVIDFEEESSSNDDLFDCEYTSVDAVINEVRYSLGVRKDKQRMEREHLLLMARV
nr:MAG TPA: hypothetical protein [Bacteriophage sp.]